MFDMDFLSEFSKLDCLLIGVVTGGVLAWMAISPTVEPEPKPGYAQSLSMWD